VTAEDQSQRSFFAIFSARSAPPRDIAFPNASMVFPLPSRCSPQFIPVSIGCARLGHPSTAVSAAFLACRVSNSLKNQKIQILMRCSGR